jgi:molybdate-binding protein
LVAPGNPLGLQGIGDVLAKRARLACRQAGAGAQVLLGHLLDKSGASLTGANAVSPSAQSETELAEMIADGKADCGLAVRVAARRFRLDFIPLHRERFDLAMRRRDYFDEPMQTLLEFSRLPAFAAHAAELTGYDLAGAGRVVYNA